MPYKYFVPESLEAQEVNTYLMNQSVMVFDSATARASSLTAPTEGMVTYLKDTNTLWIYDGSAWVEMARSTRSGLVQIIPSSVSNGTVDAYGNVTMGSGVSSVTFNGVFSSSFNNYKIVGSGGNSAAGFWMDMRMGTAVVSTGYYNVRTVTNYGAAGTLVGNATSNNIGVWTAVADLGVNFNHLNIDLFNPFLSYRTIINGFYTSDAGGGFVSGYLNDTTSYTSFMLIGNSGTINGGVVRIYGYNQ